MIACGGAVIGASALLHSPPLKMKRKLGPVAFILETTRAYQRVRNTISSLCLEGTPVYHKRSKKGYCVLAGIPRIGGTFDLHLYRYDTEKKGKKLKVSTI